MCLLIMCIALCVTLSDRVGSFPVFLPKTISSLVHFITSCIPTAPEREQYNAFWWNVAGRCKECLLGWSMLHNAQGYVAERQLRCRMCPISAETGQWSRKVTRLREDTCSNQWMIAKRTLYSDRIKLFFGRTITPHPYKEIFYHFKELLWSVPNWSQAMMLGSHLIKFS